jgi:hypothetical protein
MSMTTRVHVALWERSGHEGVYTASVRGWTLTVEWKPELKGSQPGFAWKAESPDGKTIAGADVLEEIEIAMADAEEAVPPDPEAAKEGESADAA